MLKKTYLYIFAIFFAVVSAISFYSIHHVEIHDCSVSSQNSSKKSITLPYSESSRGNKQTYTYECYMTSSIAQSLKVGIAVDDSFDSMRLNSEEISLTGLKQQYKQKKLKDWLRGYPMIIDLNAGENLIQIKGFDGGGKFGLKIAQSYDYAEYLIFFILVVIPFIFAVYYLLFDRLFESNWKVVLSRFSWEHLPYVIIILGIALRIMLLTSVSNTMYQHDYQDHVNSIKYYSEHPFDIPQVDKSVQFPQQPLYYMTSAIVYKTGIALGFNSYDALYAVRSMALVFSILWLFMAFALAKLYLRSSFSINIFMAFMALTPSFVFLGAVINNDALNAFLGIWALYEISAYAMKRQAKYFWRASLVILLASLTKISSLLFAIYFVVILLVMYFQSQEDKAAIKKQIFLFGLSILFVFGFALLKSHVPANEEFRFVNSALYSNQVIPAFDIRYFFSFSWFELIKEGQSHVLGNNDVRYSLPTYFFGTMFLGEFDHSKHFTAGSYFQFSSQIMYFLGFIYIVGAVSYLYFYKRLTRLQKWLLLPIAINTLLIVKFLSDYWVVCNSDFRYFTPTIGAIGLMITLGLSMLVNRFEWLRQSVILIIILLAIDEIYWMLQLIEKT